MYGYPTPRLLLLLHAGTARVLGKLPLVCMPCSVDTAGFKYILHYTYEASNGLHILQVYLEVGSVAVAILLLYFTYLNNKNRDLRSIRFRSIVFVPV